MANGSVIRKLSVSIILIFSFLPAIAAAREHERRFGFDPGFDFPMQGVFNETERAIFKNWIATGQRETLWSTLRDYYVRRRVAFLPERARGPVRERIDAYIDQIRYDSNTRKVIADSKKLVMPTELRDTAWATIVVVHEIEHVIQDYVEEQNSATVASLRLLRRLFDWRIPFDIEREAISAEWEIASLLESPSTQEIDIFRALRLGRGEIAFSTRILSHGHLTRGEYLAAEHEAGRYSPLNCAISTGLDLLKLSPWVGTMGLCVYSGCAQLLGYTEPFSALGILRH